MVFQSVWSNKWDAPVVSVDYTLSPEGRYPKALIECYLSYKFVVSGGLGFRVKRIVIVGDCNGGNLAVGITLKAIRDNIRVPDT
eukprot:UN04019